MVNKLLFLSLLIIIPASAYAQVADPTVAGIIVPKIASTQSQYCSDGKCGTGGTPAIPANYSKSTSKYNVLLISLSQTCEILDKHGMKGCPTVKELMPYDNSNQYISGKFIQDKNGIITRTSPQIKNNWLAYQYVNHKIICVECYFDVTASSKSQQIIIQPNSFTFVNKSETESKNAYYNFIGRSMQGCDIATIANLPGLLNDTIHYMLSGCITTSTSFNNVQNHTRILHPFSMDNPFSSLHYKAVTDKVKTLHPGLCINNQCGLTTSTKKW